MKFRSAGTRNLWLMRLYYVFYFAASGAISPFQNLFFVKNHLSGTEIGVLGTISALAGLLAAPVWGRWNDNFHRPRLVLQIALCGNSLAYYLISRQTAFLYIAILIGLNALVSSGVNPQSQTQALMAVAGTESGYGSVRLWGSVGWALTTTLVGIAVQKTSLFTAFYAMIFFNILAAAVLFFVNTSPIPALLNDSAKKEKIPMRQVIAEMVKNKELLAFLIALVLIWVASNGTSFESVYLQQMGASEFTIGLVNTVGAAVEAPMMLLADRVWRRKGSSFTMAASFLFYIIGYSIVVSHPSITSFFIFRAVDGISLGLFAVSFTYFIVERTPAQQTGTMLALYSVTVAGFISVVISPLSGWIFDRFGPYWLYVEALAGYVAALLVIYFGVLRKRRMPTAD